MKGQKGMYMVQVIETHPNGSESMAKQMGCFSSKKADKIEDGLNINLNHEKYYTKQVRCPPQSELAKQEKA